MCTSVNYSNRNNDHSVRNFAVGTAGLAAGWESETYLRRILRIPARKYISQEFKNIQGGGYKSFVETAIKQNNLEKDIKILDLNKRTADSVKKSLKIKVDKTPTTKSKIIGHILRGGGNAKSSFERTQIGQNAFFSPRDNAVVCNFEKFGAPVFHELQHKLNSKSSNIFIKTLSRIRNPLAIFGTLTVSGVSLMTDKKSPEQKSGINDTIKNNCGLLSTLCVLPLTTEEFIANIKGTKLAEKAGVTGELLNKVKKCHKISMISYAAGAIATGLAAWGGNKIRDIICSKKIPKEQPLSITIYHK